MGSIVLCPERDRCGGRQGGKKTGETSENSNSLVGNPIKLTGLTGLISPKLSTRPGTAEARYPDGEEVRHHTYLFAIDDDVMIDAAVGGNDARFINHSCDPNCDAVIENARIWIETIRDIEPGEELAYDYAYVLDERHTPAAKRKYPCNCGAAKCRGTILAKKR